MHNDDATAGERRGYEPLDDWVRHVLAGDVLHLRFDFAKNLGLPLREVAGDPGAGDDVRSSSAERRPRRPPCEVANVQACDDHLTPARILRPLAPRNAPGCVPQLGEQAGGTIHDRGILFGQHCADFPHLLPSRLLDVEPLAGDVHPALAGPEALILQALAYLLRIRDAQAFGPEEQDCISRANASLCQDLGQIVEVGLRHLYDVRP
mmetsp:Transcript_96244/g.271848  ORF Transcript_96244/g.271848 Transcript_96244/m.271848 type:complete len:207 (-) Transcript_96244:1619-2239(-)